jgi:hypothetical protein
MKNVGTPVRLAAKHQRTVIPSEARNLALLVGFYSSCPERDSSLRSE